jgi:hypothetical protein
MNDELVNKDKVMILAGDPVRDFWLEGTVNRYPDYTFRAKVYDAGSVSGIEKGRISKLQVRCGDRVVMNYERGWDQHPASRRDRNVLQEILAGFPGRQREQTSNEPGTAEGRPRARFTFSKGRRSQRIRDDDEYER